jgi:hypothetical protein
MMYGSIKSEALPLLRDGAVAQKRSMKWMAAAVLLCACVIVASVVSFMPQHQVIELKSASKLAAAGMCRCLLFQCPLSWFQL